MKFFLIILSFLLKLSSQEKLITIDMQLNKGKSYIIKNKDIDLDFSYDINSDLNIIPEKMMILIKRIIINNDVMNNCISTKYQGYNTFYCSEKKENTYLSNIYLNFNFEDYTKTIPFSVLFSKKGQFYFFNFYSTPDTTSIIFGSKLKSNINNNLRLLANEDIIEGKNETNITNHTEEAKENNIQKSGIGWLGISLIVLLSLIVIYVIYVGFRYYRRKKFQNPSFYYKITEEMFDDITPIE